MHRVDKACKRTGQNDVDEDGDDDDALGRRWVGQTVIKQCQTRLLAPPPAQTPTATPSLSLLHLYLLPTSNTGTSISRLHLP